LKVTEFKTGEFVRHRNLAEWGIGKTLESSFEGKCIVFFEHAGKKIMQDSFLVKTEAIQSAVLDHMDKDVDITSFRSKIAILKDFLDLFPEGFSCPEYLFGERDYKVEASSFIQKFLSKQILSDLLTNKNYDTILQLAQKAISKTNLIFPNEIMAFNDGIKKSQQKHKNELAEALYFNMHGEGTKKERFDRFAKALADINAAKWTIATYFLFLNDPSQFLFMKPLITQKSAKAFGFPLRYTTSIHWSAYSHLLEFGAYLKRYLVEEAKLSPVDMIDIQGFMWCADPNSYDAKARKSILDRRAKRVSIH
jgi:hypothetical protein